MHRLTGLRVLIAGVLLWALAVWIFGAPTEEPPGEEVSSEPDSVVVDSASEMPSAAEVDRSPESLSLSESKSEPMAEGSSESTSPASDVSQDISQEMSSLAPSASDSTRGSAGKAEAEESVSLPPAFSGAGLPADEAGDRPAQPDFDSPPLLPPLLPPRSFAPPPEMPPVDPSRSSSAWPPSWPQWPRPPSAMPMDLDSLLDAARKAAWEERLSEALAHYRAAANIDPENHLVWGEMGNVLWQMQRWPQAAYALEGAAILLVNAGEFRAALELMPAVESIDPDAGRRIHHHLWVVFSEWAGPRPEPFPHWEY